jgi:hypothetical protein
MYVCLYRNGNDIPCQYYFVGFTDARDPDFDFLKKGYREGGLHKQVDVLGTHETKIENMK